jgi:hypothetical protein
MIEGLVDLMERDVTGGTLNLVCVKAPESLQREYPDVVTTTETETSEQPAITHDL